MGIYVPDVTRVAPELWFRPYPGTSSETLRRLIAMGSIISTPRLGARDDRHPKGYAIGEKAMLRLKGERRPGVPSEEEVDLLTEWVEVVGLTVSRLVALTPEQLVGCGLYPNSWDTVGRLLSHFEGREIAPDEIVTIVHFAHSRS